MKPRVLLPHLQDTATYPFTEPDESRSQHHCLRFDICFNIVIVTERRLFKWYHFFSHFSAKHFCAFLIFLIRTACLFLSSISLGLLSP